MTDFSHQLLSAIQAQPDGLSLAQACAAWPDVPRRSLQRALAQAVADGIIAPIGKARATRYVNIAPKMLTYALPTQDGLSVSSTWRAEEELSTGQWPLSPDSKDIRAYLAQPWTTRHLRISAVAIFLCASASVVQILLAFRLAPLLPMRLLMRLTTSAWARQ